MRYGWVSLGRKILQSNFGSLQAPYKFTFAVTTRCNSRCRHCLCWQQKPENELSLEEIARFAKCNPYWSWVDFTGGEPTIRNDFVDIVSVFLRYNPSLMFIHFPTNGLTTDRVVEVCRQVLGLSPPRLVVTVSIDGPPEIHDTIRGVTGGFDKACRTLKALYGFKNLQVHAGLTLYPENVNEIDRTVAAIQNAVPEFTSRHLHVNIPHISNHLYHNSGTSPMVSSEMVATIKRLSKSRGIPMKPFEMAEWMYQKKIASYVRTGKCPQDCAALMASCYMGSEGTVYPCSMWDAPLGNIRDADYSIMPLLTSTNAHEMRQKLLLKGCSNCWTPCEAYQTLAANFLRIGKQ